MTTILGILRSLEGLPDRTSAQQPDQFSGLFDKDPPVHHLGAAAIRASDGVDLRVGDGVYAEKPQLPSFLACCCGCAAAALHRRAQLRNDQPTGVQHSRHAVWSMALSDLCSSLLFAVAIARDISTVVLLISGKSCTLSWLMLDCASTRNAIRQLWSSPLVARTPGGQLGVRE